MKKQPQHGLRVGVASGFIVSILDKEHQDGRLV
jgi:hypothetical protein